MIEEGLETKVPRIWTDEKHCQEEPEPGRNSDVEKVRREKIRDEKVRREKMQVRKKHAGVARGTFGSENVQNTSGPEHFSKLKCRKSARSCGAKHIWE